MHQSLHIDEILNIIFNAPILREVPEDRDANHGDDWVFRRYPLLSLALTCRNFYEPATRVLWRRIYGLDQLLRSMSHDVVQKIWSGDRVIRRTSLREYIFLKRVPSEEEWAHLERLAAYVQEFVSIDDERIPLKLGDCVIRVLGDRYINRERHIFPFLRVLSCTGSGQIQFVNFLLHLELHILRIKFLAGEGQPYSSVFSEDERRLPAISCLNHIHLSNTPSFPIKTISAFLLEHVTINLKSMHVERMPVLLEVAEAVLRCEAVEEIALRVTSFNIEDLFALDMPRPNLRRFHMESEGLPGGTEAGGRLKDGFLTALIEKLRAPNLVAFEFSGSWFPYASDIKGLLETMLGRQHSDVNQAETIRLIPPYWPQHREPPADPQPHICTFTNALHILTLNSFSDSTCSRPSKLAALDLDEVYVDLSDNELGILGASLPHLKSLIFSSRAYSTNQGKSRTTLTGLWLLAKNCKSLKNLGLLINAKIDWEAFRTLTGFDGDCGSTDARLEHYALARNVNVHNLYLGESTVGEEDIVKEFLEVVFPMIWNLVYTRSREETDDAAKWRAIKHSLSESNFC